VRDAELVDMTVEGIGDAAHMPPDGGRHVPGGVGEGWFGGAPAPLLSSKPHRRMQKNQSESPVVTHGAEAPPSLAQVTADIIFAYVSNRFTPPGM
jgi:hypothetical protein